jgi:hypothetical protein
LPALVKPFSRPADVPPHLDDLEEVKGISVENAFVAEKVRLTNRIQNWV